MKGQTYFILAIILIIFIAIFSVNNVSSVEIDYIFWQVDTPLIFIILFSVLLGGLITIFIGSMRYFKLQKENKQLKEKMKQRRSKTTPPSTTPIFKE
ncbi:MAG TPA: LapA family protein [Pseudogracilibacillus sp.]|nr:LapA family protein [Pseudogracilibacillus sp.]